MVPQASLFPLVVQNHRGGEGGKQEEEEEEGEEEEEEPWSLWEKLIIAAKFTRHAGFENTNTAVWRLTGGGGGGGGNSNSSHQPPIYLAVTDNTVAARLDVASLRVVHIYRPHLRLGQAAHFLAQPGAEANSINYRYSRVSNNDDETVSHRVRNKLSVIKTTDIKISETRRNCRSFAYTHF
jgi:hypothetical protein